MSETDDLLGNGERKILLGLVAAEDGDTRGTVLGRPAERVRDQLLQRGYIAKRTDANRYVVTDAGRSWVANTIKNGVWDAWVADPAERHRWNKARDRLLSTGYRTLPTV